MREEGRVRPGRALTGAVLAGLSGALAVGVATPASGHVTVNPGEATKGGFTKLSFRVPNERDNAGTTKIEVTFPEAQPVAHVSVRPQTGWTVTIQKAKLARPLETEGGDTLSEAVSRITWQGGLINPGEFEEFEVSAGPLPEADRMVFKAVQTYSSGEVVRWIEEAAPGGEEPDTPAPVLRLLGAESESAQGGEESTTTTSASAAEESERGEEALAASELASRRDVDSARRLAFAGIALGALGLALGLKRRR